MAKKTIQIEWLDELIRWLNKIDIKDALRPWVQKILFFYERQAKKETPVDTWLLRNSYSTVFSTGAQWLEWTLLNYRAYWINVHEWTSSIRANPWMTRVLNDNKNASENIMGKEIEKILISLQK